MQQTQMQLEQRNVYIDDMRAQYEREIEERDLRI